MYAWCMNLYGYIIFVPYCSECSPTRNTRTSDVRTGHCPRHYDGFSRLHASARGSGTISVAYAAVATPPLSSQRRS